MVPDQAAAILFFLDNLGDDFAQLVEDICFGHSQGNLIGDLEDVADTFIAFAVHPGYGEAEFSNALDDAVEPLHEDQGRDVDGHADGQARTGQGRTGREVTEIVAEGEIQVAFQGIVDLGRLVPDALEVETRCCRLDAEMVFFIDHDRHGPVFTEQEAPVLGLFDMTGRGKMFHCQHFPFQRRQFVEADEGIAPMAQGIEGTNLAFALFEDGGQFRIRRLIGKDVFLQVPVQADAAVDDDIVEVSRAVLPGAERLLEHIVDHGLFPLSAIRQLTLEGADLIADFRRFFIAFFLAQFLQVLAQSGQPNFPRRLNSL